MHDILNGTAVFLDWVGGVKRGRVERPRHGGGYYVTLEDGTPIGAPAFQVFVRESDAWQSVIEGLRRQREQINVRLAKAQATREASIRRERGVE